MTPGKRLFWFFGLFFLSLALNAQAVLREATFRPPTFYVGDSVELRLSFDVTNPIHVSLPREIPDSDWADIRDIRIEENGKVLTVIIEFVPFAPGTRTLPALELGGLTLTDIKIPTHSILQNWHEDSRNLRGQLLLPGTRLGLALILAFVAMAPFFIYGIVRLFWTWFKRSRERYRIGRPARRIRKIVKKLNSGIGTMAPVLWYAELTHGLRSYLSSRSVRDCRSATTAEIAAMPGFSAAGTPAAGLLEVLKKGDLVKFAGQIADDRSLKICLEEVERHVRDWEKNVREKDGGDD